jgi:hypothetical protein
MGDEELILELLCATRGSVLPEDLVDELPTLAEEYASDQLRNDPLLKTATAASQPHGGAYQIKEFVGYRMELACHKSSAQARHRLERITLKEIHYDAAIRALAAGEVHIVGPINDPRLAADAVTMAESDPNFALALKDLCCSYVLRPAEPAHDDNRNVAKATAHLIRARLADAATAQGPHRMSMALVVPTTRLLPPAISGKDPLNFPRGGTPPVLDWGSRIPTRDLVIAYDSSDPHADRLAAVGAEALRDTGVPVALEAVQPADLRRLPYNPLAAADLFIVRLQTDTPTRQSFHRVMRYWLGEGDLRAQFRSLFNAFSLEDALDWDVPEMFDGTGLQPLALPLVAYLTRAEIDVRSAIGPDGYLDFDAITLRT